MVEEWRPGYTYDDDHPQASMPKERVCLYQGRSARGGVKRARRVLSSIFRGVWDRTNSYGFVLTKVLEYATLQSRTNKL